MRKVLTGRRTSPTTAQRYNYFTPPPPGPVLRQGGEFLITRTPTGCSSGARTSPTTASATTTSCWQRMGEDLPILVEWTAHDAVNDLDANGSSTNTLTVEADGDTVRFLVNGTEVSSQARSAVDADGITGLRVTHMLNVHVSDLDLGN